MRHKVLRNLIFTGLLVAMGIVLTYVIVFAYPPGQVNLKVGIGWVPLILISIFFGPFYGLLAGVAQDTLGYFMFGTANGPYYFGFTVNAMIVGVLPWLVLLIKSKKAKIFLYLNYALAGLVLLGSIYLIVDIHVFLAHTTMTVGWSYVILSLSIVASVIFGVFVFTKRKLEARAQQIIFMVVAVMVVTSLILTPVWLHNMYNLPYWSQLPLRIAKLPLEVFVYSLLVIELDNRFGKEILKLK